MKVPISTIIFLTMLSCVDNTKMSSTNPLKSLDVPDVSIAIMAIDTEHIVTESEDGAISELDSPSEAILGDMENGLEEQTTINPKKEAAKVKQPDPKPSTSSLDSKTLIKQKSVIGSPDSDPPTKEIPIVEVKKDIPIIKELQSVSHEAFNQLLNKYVSENGSVNYEEFINSESTLNNYIEQLGKNEPANSWTNNDRLAYWINLYNANTIKLILDNYPVESITKLNGGKPWDKKWISVGAKTLSLNQIENEIIRPKFNDARIHFAVNCAAKSCPTLYNKAFVGSLLNTQLDKVTKKFINQSSEMSLSEDSIKVSKIFEWYQVDFKTDLIAWINKYSTVIVNTDATIKYTEYDWSLNN